MFGKELPPLGSYHLETRGLDLVNKLFALKYKTQYLVQVYIFECISSSVYLNQEVFSELKEE